MLTMLGAIAPVAMAAADPLVSISSCAFTPSELTLNYGDSAALNITTDAGNGAYVEYTVGSQTMGQPSPVTSNNEDVTQNYSDFSQFTGPDPVDLLISLYATDGTTKVGSSLCSLTIHLGAMPVETTTTVVPVLAHTGSQSGNLFLASALLIVSGCGLVLVARRRSDVD